MLGKKLLIELKEYVEIQSIRIDFPLESPINMGENIISRDISHVELEDFVQNTLQPTFSQLLFSFIDHKGATDTDIYKKAGIDRRHFSKIRSNPDYRPKKNTVIALAMSLELDKKNANKLLSSAGYSLSESDAFDLVIQFCLNKKIYNINDVNQALDYLNLRPLTGVLK